MRVFEGKRRLDADDARVHERPRNEDAALEEKLRGREADFVAREFEGDQQAFAAHVDDDIFVPMHGFAQPVEHVRAEFRRALGETLFEQHVDRRERGRAGERIAAERRGVQERVIEEPREDGLRRDDRTGRHDAAAERFREAQDVGHDVVVFAREHLPGAAHPGLHFVEDQQRAELVAERAHGGQIRVVRNDYPALTLDRFEQHRPDVVARRAARDEDVLQRRDVVERHVLEAREHAAERQAECGFAARGERAEALAVETARRDDDLLFVRIVRARELERRFDRLRPAIAEERILQIARRQHRERLREHRAQRIEQILTVQRLPIELRAHGRHHFGMPMADVEDPEAAEAVDVFAAVDVREDVPAVGPLDRGRERALRAGLAILEKAGIDVIAKAVDRLADDPRCLFAIDRGRVDEI